MPDPPHTVDRAALLRALTPARVAIGRIGAALPTRAMLDFQRAHAQARDAVEARLESAGFAAAIGRPVVEVSSRAGDHATYLQRPDLGRRLAEQDGARLARGEHDVAIVVGDGLSAAAVHAHAASMVRGLAARLEAYLIAPVVIARHARVALGDEIGAALGARLVVMLIGERPGLSAPDSLGAYITWQPRVGRLDSERNCVSNIRPPHGLGYDEAADTIAWLVREAFAHGITGVALKDESGEVRLVAPERDERA